MTDHNDFPPVTNPKPLTPVVTYWRDTGTVAVTVQHDEAAGIYACTDSFSFHVNMPPHLWRQYIAAVVAVLDEIDRAEKLAG